MIVDDSGISLRFSQPPGRTSSSLRGQSLILATSDIQADANITVRPSRDGEVLPIGWKFGFIQLQLAETNWAYYKGASAADGSVLVNYGNSLARGTDLCRDSEKAGQIWYTGAGDADSTKESKMAMPLPWTLPTFYFGDSPEGELALEFRNPKTGKLNRLDEAKLSLSFLTTLSMRDPQVRFTHLRHFTWGVTWHVRRAPGNTPRPDFPFLPGSGGSCSPVRIGPPSSALHRAMLTDEGGRARNCNEVASGAVMHPVVEASTKWQRFDGMK
ncbi:MAG: hypothetical protein NTW74_11725 [Acidobacteria bacterium]|nr:hypothetical protein [Acidobacteriota bacterium]